MGAFILIEVFGVADLKLLIFLPDGRFWSEYNATNLCVPDSVTFVACKT